MDELKEQSQQLIQTLIQLHPTKDKRRREQLRAQLWEMINNLELNPKLCLLISLICQLDREKKSEKLIRNQLLTWMIEFIDQSNKFAWAKNHSQYKNYYDEAVLQIYEYLRENAHKYNPDHESGATVITWLNGHLKWKLNYLKNHGNQTQFYEQKKYVFEDGEETNYLDNVESNPDGENAMFLLNQIRDWAEDEAELKTIFVTKQRSDITASKVILRKLPPQDKPWTELAEEFNISIPTLSSFYERHCRPKIKEYVEFLGYELPDTPTDPVQDIKLIIHKVEKVYKNKDFVNQLQEWVNTALQLRQIICKTKTELTGYIFLDQLLNLLKTKPKLQTRFLAMELNIEVTEAEKFYEFRIRPELHNFLESKQYNLSNIYN